MHMNVMGRQTLLSAKPKDCPTVPWDGEDIRAEERVQRVQREIWMQSVTCVRVKTQESVFQVITQCSEA